MTTTETKYYRSGNGQLLLCERHKWPSGESVGGFRKIPAAIVAALKVELTEFMVEVPDNICESCELEAREAKLVAIEERWDGEVPAGNRVVERTESAVSSNVHYYLKCPAADCHSWQSQSFNGSLTLIDDEVFALLLPGHEAHWIRSHSEPTEEGE